MKIVDWLLRREAKSSPPMTLAADGAWQIFGGGGPTSSGMAIGSESAMRVPAVRAAVALIAESCGQLSWKIYRRSGGGREEDTSHPLARMFRDGPNGWTTWPEFISSLVSGAIRTGRGHALCTRSAGGDLLEVLHLPTGFVSRIQPTPVDEPRFMVTTSAGTVSYARSDVLELNTLDGRSIVAEGKEAIGLAAALERHAGKILGSGARPGGVLERSVPTGGAPAPARSPEQHREQEQRFNDTFGGLEAAGRTVMLPVGATFKALTFSSVDMEFSEMRKFQVEEIARIFRVPPTLLQQLEKATYNNSEVLGAQFVKFSLLHWINAIEAALRLSCLTADEREIYDIEGDVSDFLRADTQARFDSYASGITNGVLTQNEARHQEDLPPMPGGDELRFPLNTGSSAAEPQKGVP